MSLSKSYFWDEAEAVAEKIINKVKAGTLGFEEGVKELMASNVALGLIGIEDEYDAEEYISYGINE